MNGTPRPSSRASNGSPSRPSSSSSIHPPPASKAQRPGPSAPKSRLRSYTSTDSIPRSISASTPRHPSSSAPTKSTPHPSPGSSSPKAQSTSPEVPIPFYISPLHPPSTNPSWLDIKASEDFASDVDSGSRVVKVTLWARRKEDSPTSVSHMSSRPTRANHPPSDLRVNADAKGKGRASDRASDLVDPHNHDGGAALQDWKVLTSWDVDLDKLQPFAPDVRISPTSHANTYTISHSYISISSHRRPKTSLQTP